jgi:hypothetical protein
MGFSFHFLKTAAKDVGNAASTVARGNSNPGGGVFGFLGNVSQVENNVKQNLQQKTGGSNAPGDAVFNFIKSSNQQLAKIPETAIRSTAELEARTANKFGANLPTDYSAPTNSLTKKLYGTNEVQTYQQRGEGIHQAHPNIPAPIAAAGIAGLDLTPGGGKKNLADELVKSSTAKDAFKALTKSGVDENIAHKIAPAVAQTKDPNIINNIIDNAHKPPVLPPSPIQDIRPPTSGAEGDGKGTAINSFLQTVRNANTSTTEFKDAVGGLKQTHELRNTEQLSNEAQKTVGKDYVGSLTQVLSSPNPTDKEVAMGQHLIVQAQQDGRVGEAVNIAEHLDNTLREHGRAVQAASIMSRLSPEGRLLAATRKVSRARESSPNFAKEGKTAEDIKNQLEAPVIGKKEVSNTVKEIANETPTPSGQLANEATTGEQLAKNVEKAATPTVKKPTDALVQELTKKVKQEYLAPVSQVKRDPLDILKETFGRADEAHQAYPEAQQILRDKFANDPKMSGALDKFFGSKLDLPAANSTINRAIQNQLKTNGDRVSEVIHKSLVEQGQTVEQTARELTKEGFDEQSAKTLAGEVTKRLNSQITDAKKAKLEQLSKSAKEKNQPTFLEKVNKLSNLGALTNEDYLHLARAKLNLPHLNDAAATKISDLSQKIQGLSDGEEKYKLIRELHDTVNGSIPSSKGEIFRQIFAAPRSTQASFDISFGGRQGAVLGTRFPKEWGAAQKDSVKGFKSQKYYDNKIAELNTRSDMPSEYLALREKAGVAITGGPDALHEEAFASSLPEKVPVLGKGVEASDRAYTLGLSSLRDKTFEKIYREYENVKPMSTWSDEEIKSIGRFINTASGRGDLGKYLEAHGKTLQEALFSPKLWKSRLDMLNPLYYYKLKGPARKYALQSAATFTGTAASVMALAAAAGATVDGDARSSDFLKIKVGDTRFDILGGLQQNLVFLHRELPGSIAGQKTYIGSGEKKSSQTGKITDLSAGGFGAANRLSILSDLFQSKESPSISAITTQIKGQDKSGNQLTPTTRLKDLGSLGVPLSIGDTYNNIQHSQSVAGGIAKSVPGFVGIGVNSYGTQDLSVTGKQKAYLDQLKTSGADAKTINANKQFFQVLKGAPNKQTAIDSAHKALDSGDYQKAQKIAQDYNNSLDQYIQQSGWVDKNSSYINPTLEKAYSSAKFNLNSQSVQQYLKSKQGA